MIYLGVATGHGVVTTNTSLDIGSDFSALAEVVTVLQPQRLQWSPGIGYVLVDLFNHGTGSVFHTQIYTLDELV